VYKDFDRTNYSHEIQSKYTTCCGTPWDGTYFLTQGGTARSADRDQGRELPLFRGHHVPQYDDGDRGRQKGIAGAEGLTVKHSRFEDVGVGSYIADNTFIGRNDPDAVFGWLSQWPWSSQPGFEQNRKLRSVEAGLQARLPTS
jgi:hypothetical protein